MALTISIIVPCRNEVGSIGRFLESLAQQDFADYDWEVIIADGLSDDGTRQWLNGFMSSHERVRVIDNPEKITSTGLNAAILAAKGAIILRMDVHTEYARDYVRGCVETLLSTKADNVGGPARTRAEGWLPKAIAAAYHSRFACGGAKFHDETYEGLVDTVPYGCWRKETLETLGLFDPALVRNQDDELNLRLVRRGGTIWQSAAIKSWYSPRSSISALFRQYYQYGFWKVPVILKYRIPASLRHLAPGSFVLVNILLLAIAATSAALGYARVGSVSFALLALILLPYLACIAVFSVVTARQNSWALLPYLPPVFVTYHVSYGLGFLTAVICTGMGRFQRFQASKVFTQVTR